MGQKRAMSTDRRAWGAITLVTLLSTTACQSRDHPQSLKIGTLLPITGDLSQYGTSMQDSANLLVETVNACGGVDLNQWGDVTGQYVIWTIAEDGRLATVGEIFVWGQ